MQQIADWLEKLGLSEYAQRFAENDIDFAILGDLTDQDLEKIGVASLGQRCLPLRAIGELDSIGEGGRHCHGTGFTRSLRIRYTDVKSRQVARTGARISWALNCVLLAARFGARHFWLAH